MKKPSYLDEGEGIKNRSCIMKGPTWSRRDLVGIKCYSVFSGVKLQMVKLSNIGFPMLFTSGR